MTDDPRWRRFPIFREFFLQWRKARGAVEPGTQRKAFSRDWEDLLRDAGLLSALDRREAVRDVRLLQNAGLLLPKTPSQRPHEILRITLPLDAEPRLRALFADEIPQKIAPFDFTSVQWVPELAFLTGGGVNVAADDLIKLNDFFREGRSQTVLNIKERSLQIFGDEKRLDALCDTTLFREERMSLEMLRCYRVAEPLGWERGPNKEGPILVIENACTWDTYSRWNSEASEFSGIVYGGGNRFMDCVTRLPDVFAELGGVRRILYFGDIDPQGLRIPRRASTTATRCHLPPIEPDLWSYARLLEIGHRGSLGDLNDVTNEDLAWIAPLDSQVKAILGNGTRIAQEGITFEHLRGQKHRL